jgi:Uma2 family endonuclease
MAGSSMVVSPAVSEWEMSETSNLRMSYEEFLHWLDEDKHAEWVNGEVIMHSPVSYLHNTISGFLLRILGFYAEEHDLGTVLYEPFLMKIGEAFPGRAPDVMFVKKENLHRVQRHVLNGPADVIVEIISPESRGRDRGEKYYEYEVGGVSEYCLIDPDRQTVEYYRLDANGHYQVVLPDARNRIYSSVLPGFYFVVGWFWQEPFPSLRTIMAEWAQ